MRTPKILTAVALLASTLTAGLIGSASPASAAGVAWCDPVTPAPPCISSMTINGTDVRSSPDWGLLASTDSSTGSNQLAVNLVRMEDSSWHYELGEASLDDVVVIKVLTGSLVPRLVSGKARDTAVSRAGSGSAHEVTVTGTPVIVSGQCTGSGTCPEYPSGNPELDVEWVGYFDFTVSDYGAWDDATQREAFYGMNYFTNVAHTSVPPQVVDDPGTGDQMLRIDLANRHFRSDGKTVVKGHGELRIPNAFLQEVYGIPDPATMTGMGLTPSLSGSGPGSLTSVQESGGSAMLVTYDNVTFSRRVLRVATGVITPTRPTQVNTTRTAARRGFVDFEPSEARGAAVAGYAGRCVAVRGDHVVTAVSDDVVGFAGFRKGIAYDCKVRALSKVGPSKWSNVVRMDAKVFEFS